MKHPKARRFAFDPHRTGQAFCLARYIPGVVAAETVAAPISAATGPFAWREGMANEERPLAFNTAGARTCIVTVAFDSPDNGAVSLRPMVLDQEGLVWLDLELGGLKSQGLDGTYVWEFLAHERTVLFVVDSVTNTVSNLEILIAPSSATG